MPLVHGHTRPVYVLTNTPAVCMLARTHTSAHAGASPSNDLGQPAYQLHERRRGVRWKCGSCPLLREPPVGMRMGVHKVGHIWAAQPTCRVASAAAAACKQRAEEVGTLSVSSQGELVTKSNTPCLIPHCTSVLLKASCEASSPFTGPVTASLPKVFLYNEL